MESLRSAADRLVILLGKAEADLKAVTHRYEEEFQQRYAGKGANPLSILQRLKKLQRELPRVKEECAMVTAAKQEAMCAAKQQLEATRQLLEQLESRAGIPSASEQPEEDPFQHFTLSLARWEACYAAYSAAT